jgi:uncharacterized membrane protein
VTPEEQARFEALERRVAELERRFEPKRRHARTFRPAPRWEVTFGLNWISRIAVVTVVLALAFFFQYAFEVRLIGETGRVALGLTCGAAAFAASEIFFRKDQRAYAQALGAAGAAFFYLSIWAAFGLYHLMSQLEGLILMAVTTAAAGFLALRYDSSAVALLGFAGGFATPLLLRGGDQPWFVLSYALVLSVGAVAAARARDWRWPEALAIAGTAVLYLNQLPARPFFAVFVLAAYGVFALSSNAMIFIAAEILAPVALATIWAPGEAGLAAALALTGIGLAVRPATATGAFAGFWLAYAFWHADSGYTPLAVLTAAYALFLAWPLWRRARLGLDGMIALALNAGFYFGASYGLLRTSYQPWVGLFAVGVATAQAAAARLLWNVDRRAALLAAGTAWVILILAAPIQFAGYRVTVTWAAEAAAMVWIGVRLGERRAVRAGVALLAVVVARLALSDSRMAVPSAFASSRFLAFAVTAAAFWATAWWVRNGRTAVATYEIGHAVMLWGLILEAVSWASRTASPENLGSVTSTAISVIAATYAVLLVAGGAAWGHGGSRLSGIGLIGIAVLKLYLYDVWLLEAFYRMAAFAILGVMLLVMSYLYSRRAGRGPAAAAVRRDNRREFREDT